MKKTSNINIKRLIILVFFFLPGGFLMLSILMIINELFLNKKTDE